MTTRNRANPDENSFYGTEDIYSLISSVGDCDDLSEQMMIVASVCGLLLANKHNGNLKRVIRRIWGLAVVCNGRNLIPRRSRGGFWELMSEGVCACFKSGKMRKLAIAHAQEASQRISMVRTGTLENPIVAPQNSEFYLDTLVNNLCSLIFDCGKNGHSAWVVLQGIPTCLLPEIYVNGTLAKRRYRYSGTHSKRKEEFCLDPFCSNGRTNRVTFCFNSRMADAISCRGLDQATITLEFRGAGAETGPRLLNRPEIWYSQMDVVSRKEVEQQEGRHEDDDCIFVMDDVVLVEEKTCPISGETPIQMPVVSTKCDHPPNPFGLVSFIESLRQRKTRPRKQWACPHCSQEFTPADLRRYE